MTKIPRTDERRAYSRNNARRVVLIIEGKPYLANDWSPSGFCIDYPHSGLQKGDTLIGEIDIFEVEDKGRFTATVVRILPEGQLAVKFTDLSSHSYINLCMTVSVDEDEFQ